MWPLLSARTTASVANLMMVRRTGFKSTLLLNLPFQPGLSEQKKRLHQRYNTYKSSARAGFHYGQSGCWSLLRSVRDGKKHLPVAQKEARALLNEAGASSNPSARDAQ